MKIHRRNSRTFLLIILGMLSAFGPFVTDFYLPGLPSIGDYFDVPASMVQLSLTSSMLGLAGGQLLVGPISDKYGRKRPILITLGLFVAATVACLFAWDIYSFVLFRLFQGIAGAGGIVLSKSVAADLYEGKELRRFFSMLMVVNGLSPILAPVFGGFLLNFTDWHGIFVTLLVIGILLFAVNLRISESLLKHRRIQGSVWGTFRAFVPILRHRRFMYYVLTQAFGMGVFFTYIASSPFILQQHYGLSPIGYSVYQRSGHHRRQLAGRPVPQGKQRAVGRPVGPGRFRRPVRDDPAVRTSVRIPGVHAFPADGRHRHDPADLDGPRARHRTRTLRQRFGRDRVFPIPLRRDRFAADRSGRYPVADRSADRML